MEAATTRLVPMNLTTQLPTHVNRLRYDYDGGAPWDSLDLGIPHIGELHTGDTCIIAAFTISKGLSPHSTGCFGNECQGGIYRHTFEIKNKDEHVRLKEWAIRHISKKNAGKAIEEKRQVLWGLVGEESLKKSLLYEAYQKDDDIHEFMLCVECYVIQKSNGKAILWGRVQSNLCTETQKKRSHEPTKSEVVAKKPVRCTQEDPGGSSSHTNGYYDWSTAVKPDDNEHLADTFGTEYEAADGQNDIPLIFRRFEHSTPEQGPYNIPTTVKDCEEDSLEILCQQPSCAEDGYHLNYDITGLPTTSESHTQDLTTLSLNVPDENITVEPFRPDKETVCAPAERLSAPNQMAVVHSDGSTPTPFDTSEEDSVSMTSAEDIISQKRVLNEVFRPGTSFSQQIMSNIPMEDYQCKMMCSSGMPTPTVVANCCSVSLELPELRFYETSPSEFRDLDVNITPEQWIQTPEEFSAALSTGILYHLLFDADQTT